MIIKNKKSSIIVLLINLLSYGLVFAFGQLREQVLLFHANITVNTNGSLDVTETITVWSSGDLIKRGIVREFPTRYKNQRGNNVVVDFHLNSVLKDGTAIPYQIKDKANGKVIELGDDSFIKRGEHVYTISYTTNRQLGFYKEYDELYWNVTGNGWKLPIYKASAHITLPNTIPKNSIKVNGYTGSYGTTSHNYDVETKTDGSLFFSTTMPLDPREGLTIVVIWQKGFITEPDWLIQWWYFFKDNIFLLWALIGTTLLILFCLFEWRKINARNKKETIIPQFYPPKNVSSGAVYYLTKTSFDPKAFAAEIVELAVRGFLTIEYKPSKGIFNKEDYLLVKSTNYKSLASVQEKNILNQLFSSSDYASTNKDKEKIVATVKTFQSHLENSYKDCFLSQTWFISCFCLIFGSSILLPLFLYSHELVVIFFPFIMIIFFIISLFKTYSDKGLKLKAQIDGFKMFLETTETERFKVIGTAATRTPELYEKYLPYAIALGVESAWSNQFAPVFAELEQQGRSYNPIWYRGRTFSFLNATSFASDLNSSFGSAISACATPPGSRSGFRGGSSGGGGGGGGGGGR